MGQKHGKAIFYDSAGPFLNLSHASLIALWNAYHDIAEGFGLSSTEFREICAELTYELGYDNDEHAMDRASDALFHSLDTDKNGLVDALEFLTAIGVASTLVDKDKLDFVFRCYDFNGLGSLTFDELSLATRMALIGLFKLSGEAGEHPSDSEIDVVSKRIFDKFRACKDDGSVSLEFIVNFHLASTESRGWLLYFGNPKEVWTQNDVVNELPDQAQIHKAQNEGNNVPMESMPWFEKIQNAIPAEYTDKHMQSRLSHPTSQLRLEWVYGYRQWGESRNNVRYSQRGEICYHAAQVGIVYDCDKHRQRIYNEHSGEILSFAIHPDEDIIATGEDGFGAKIIVWDTKTIQSISVLYGFQECNGVEHLSFSGANGERLASVGKRPGAFLCVYEWKTGQRLFAAFTTTLPTHDVTFGSEGVVSCGHRHIFFWQESRQNIKRRGIFRRNTKCKSHLCVAPLKEKIITGTYDGYLCVFAGRNCVRLIKAHRGSLDAIHVSPYAIITGGSDGRVRFWTLALRKGAIFDMSSLSRAPALRSVCLSPDNSRIAIGTEGGIYEISATDGSNVNHGPVASCNIGSCGELLGLAVHPLRHEVCTVGSDSALKIFDIPTKSVVRIAWLKKPANCAVYAPSGEFICIGYGRYKDGNIKTEGAVDEGMSFSILKASDLSSVHEGGDLKGIIIDAKFSLDGERLALASSDGAIHLYNPGKGYRRIGKIQCTEEVITNLDFSEDGEWIQATTGAGELVFASVEELVTEDNVSFLRDTVFSSQTCTFGWSTIGAWQSKSGVPHSVTACDRSESEDSLVVADADGKVTLWSYPCFSYDASCATYYGHAGPVSKVSFANGDTHVISIGLNDRCVFQWKHIEDGDSGWGSTKQNGKDVIKDESSYVDEGTVDIFAMEKEEKNRRNPGSSFVPHLPSSTLTLDFIHVGGGAKRSGLKYTVDDCVAFSAANIGVIFNPWTREQKHNIELSGPGTCFAVSSCKKYLATASSGQEPSIVVFDSNAQTVKVIKVPKDQVLSGLTFSADGALLAASGNDEKRCCIVKIYNWKNSLLVSSSSTGFEQIYCVKFSPSGRSLIQAGKKHIRFLDLYGGRNIAWENAKLCNRGIILQDFYCADYLQRDKKVATPVVGTEDGRIYVFHHNELILSVKAHKKEINSMSVSRSGSLITGSSDGLIKQWVWKERAMECINEISIKDILPNLSSHSVWSIDIALGEAKIIVGTQAQEILEISLADGLSLHDGPVLHGHSGVQVTDAAPHPLKLEYVTVGDDGVARFWNSESMTQSRSIYLDGPCAAVEYSNDGRFLAIGADGNDTDSRFGTFFIFKESDLIKLHQMRVSSASVTAMKYCPDDTVLAVATLDGIIALFDVRHGYTKSFKITVTDKLPGGPFQHWAIDFSTDSQYLRVRYDFGKVIFAETTHGCLIPDATALGKSTKWETLSAEERQLCGTYGTWAKGNNCNELVFGDSLGQISLLQNTNDVGSCLRYYGHTAVSKVFWSHDNSFVYSIGWDDNSVIQWRHSVTQPEAEQDNSEEKGSQIFPANLLQNSEEAHQGSISLHEMPWKKEMLPPLNTQPAAISLPAYELKLEYIHACHSANLRCCIKYNAAGNIIHTSQSIAIITNQFELSQQFHISHKGDITCLAVSRDHRFASTASAEEGGASLLVSVWDTWSGATIITFRSLGTRYHESQSRGSLSFSNDGKYLAFIYGGKGGTISIFRSLSGEWVDGLKTSFQSCPNTSFVTFVGDINFPLMCVGGTFCSFMSMEGKTLIHKEVSSTSQPLSCGCCSKVGIVTGTLAGSLLLWKEEKCHFRVCNSIDAHDGCVHSVECTGTGVVSGGADGTVFLWDANLTKIRSLNMKEIIPRPHLQAVTSVCYDPTFSGFLVGMEGGEMISIGESDSGIVVSESHGRQRINGVTMNPRNPSIFATCGSDAFIRIWDLENHCVLKRKRLECEGTALSWNLDGSLLCIGLGKGESDSMKDGSFILVDVSSMSIVFEDRKSKKSLRDIKYDASGRVIAMGGNDGCIYVHNASTYKLNQVTEKISSPIHFLDFSLDGQYLRAASSDFRLAIFAVLDGDRISTLDACDIVWQTHTCPYGWNVQGLWKDGDSALFSVDVCQKKALVAFNKDNGEIGLGNFPALGEEIELENVVGHGSSAATVRFNITEKALVSSGRTGCSIMQYCLIHSDDMDKPLPFSIGSGRNNQEHS